MDDRESRVFQTERTREAQCASGAATSVWESWSDRVIDLQLAASFPGKNAIAGLCEISIMKKIAEVYISPRSIHTLTHGRLYSSWLFSATPSRY